uniref:NAD(P)(+)--arginine ADP-ribosyltransferase n=1 Tax=Mola mola TaxID=94237 RepID=A0A3Q3XMN1_MOLML
PLYHLFFGTVFRRTIHVLALVQQWPRCFLIARDTSTNFSQAWSNAEQRAPEPAHKYMEKSHSVAIYMYTDTARHPVKQVLEAAERTKNRPKETFDSRSLYFYLSEATQILKHSQVTCLTTHYRTEQAILRNTTRKLIRFNTFILGSDGHFKGNATRFEIYTCFGANVTYYSAVKQTNQVLIPPYEVFKITDIGTDELGCEAVYRLKSNLNCVYDRESNSLFPKASCSIYSVDFYCGQQQHQISELVR